MATKGQRHARIARLIQEKPITSQQELAERLSRAGIEVTQATLSRDLQQLGVLKGPSGYVLPQPQAIAPYSGAGHRLGTLAAAPRLDQIATQLERTLRRELRTIDAAGHLIVVRTDPGHANALAVELDRARLPDVIGTIAGDDTVMLVARRTGAAARLVRKLRTMASAD